MLSRVVLLISSLAVNIALAATCVDLTSSSTCVTGNCANGGHLYGWSIPAANKKPQEADSEYLLTIKWADQVVTGRYSTSAPGECCAECNKRSKCKYWQFVKDHPNGDKNICFLYPKAPPVCDGTSPKTNAGAKCPDSCPDLTLNSTCTTCKGGGNNYGWSIPAFSPFTTPFPKSYVLTVKWEDQVVTGVFNAPKATVCCSKCKKRTSCKYWQFVENHPNGATNVCFFYPKNPPSCAFGPKTPAGAKCPGFGGDPHFVGAQGTNFDFTGQPNKAFCLLSDKNLHVNMKMTGYLDERLESATVIRDGKAVRSWIRELGFLWLQGGNKHTLKLVARTSGQAERGSGFLALAELDGEKIPHMDVGNEVSLPGGLDLKFEEVEVTKNMEIEQYSLKIEGLLEMELNLRPAQPQLRRKEDAEVHFDVAINKIHASSSVHGVLGQTYRADRAERAAAFRSTGDSVVADGESGKGFLDGSTADYIASDVLASDCSFSAFEHQGQAQAVVSIE